MPEPPAPHIRVLIADDHAAVREGVRGVLATEDGIEVIGEAADGPSALRLVRELRPDLVVLDNSMPGLSGLDVSRKLAAEHPDVAVVFLTLDPALRDLALAGGGMAYVLKDAPSDELVRAVRATTTAIAARRRLAGLPSSWRRALDLLVSTRTLRDAQLDAILAQRQPEESLAPLLRRVDAVGEPQPADVLARAAGPPLVSLAPSPEIGRPIAPTEDRLAATRMVDPIDPAAARALPLDLSRSMHVALIAMSASEGTGVLAMADPLDDVSFAEAQRATRLRLTRVTATAPEIAEALDRAWTSRPTPAPFAFRLSGAWRPLLGTLAIIGVPSLGVLLLFREGLAPNRILALFALLCGIFFFVYALKYYVTSAAVLAIAVFGDTLVPGKRAPKTGGKSATRRLADGATKTQNLGEHREGYKTLRGEKLDEVGAVADAGPLAGEARLPIARQPFVSVQVALYNEARVVDRLLAACTSFDYENYEVLVADDSTDETIELLSRWRSHPRVKIVHRSSRAGFKGGALQEALRRMNPKAEYVMIFDADFIPPKDAIWHFLDYFGRLANGNGHAEHANGNGAPKNGDRLAAVQGYQWLYTPYIQAPAECVSTIRRLIKQRMRWAEGHTYNVKKYFFKVLASPNLSWKEKVEFVYYAPYYLQSVVFAFGTVTWILSDLLLGQRLPSWSAILGWSLVVTNVLALPLMNLAGVLLEGSLRRDAAGLLSFIGLSWLLVPFQAYASVKGLLEREEGGWVRTPKSGRVTEALGQFKLAKLLPWELPKRRQRKRSRVAQLALTCFATAIAIAILGVGALSVRAAGATGRALDVELAIPTLLGTAVPLVLLGLGWLKLRQRIGAVAVAMVVALSVNVVFLAGTVPAEGVTDNSSVFTFARTITYLPSGIDMKQNYTPAGSARSWPVADASSG